MKSVSRVRGLRFSTVSSEIDKAPKRIKIFVDHPNLGFDDADSLEPAQELELNQAQAKGTLHHTESSTPREDRLSRTGWGTGEQAIELRYVKFQRVNSLQIFIVDNQEGGEVTRIDSLDILGQSVEATRSVICLQIPIPHLSHTAPRLGSDMSLKALAKAEQA
jgi:hypothetical protein